MAISQKFIPGKLYVAVKGSFVYLADKSGNLWNPVVEGGPCVIHHQYEMVEVRPLYKIGEKVLTSQGLAEILDISTEPTDPHIHYHLCDNDMEFSLPEHDVFKWCRR